MKADNAAKLFATDAVLEVLYSGMERLEGPVYFAQDDRLVFSDIPSHQLLEWTPRHGARVVGENSNFNNGSTCDWSGRRIGCEHLTSSVVRVGTNGTREILASHYDGRRLNSPKDVVVSRDGAVWFTDPTYGIMSEREGQSRVSEQTACRVYRIDAETGAVEAMCDTLKMPNGLAFSPDEATLYVADSSRSHFDDGNHHLFAFDVNDGRRLSNQRTFYEIVVCLMDCVLIR